MKRATPRTIDLIGHVFGRLTVIAAAPKAVGRAGAVWACRCECGRVRQVDASSLKRRRRPTRSCGCLAQEITGDMARRHGGHDTPEYHAWHAMKQRCYLPTLKMYPRYGGRGITVCDRWRDSFPNFLADMGTRPTSGHSLDRINNDGHYEPSNCRWATIYQQNQNRENGRYLTHEGATLNLVTWAARTGISVQTLRRRVAAGWPADELLSKRPWHRRHA